MLSGKDPGSLQNSSKGVEQNRQPLKAGPDTITPLVVKALRDEALLKVEVTPHICRHSFCSRLLREVGTDLVTVAALMGHSSIATTAIYTQPTEEDKEKAVEGLA